MSRITNNLGTSSTTYITNWPREILFQNFSDMPIGQIKQIELNFSARHGTANQQNTIIIKIFSGLNLNWKAVGRDDSASDWWKKRTDDGQSNVYAWKEDKPVPTIYYYNENNHSNFLNGATILAEGEFSLKRKETSQINSTFVFSGDQINQKNLENWSGDIYLAIYAKDSENAGWSWPINSTPQITFDYAQESTGTLNSSTIKLGETSTLKISPNNSAYKHKVYWICGNKTEVKEVGAGVTSCSYTIPKDWGAVFPYSNNYPGTVQLQTYSGSSLIGTKTFSITYSVPNYPIAVSASIEYVHDYSFGQTRYFSNSSFYNKRDFLSNKTTAKCTISVTTPKENLYGASISNYTTRQTNSSGSIISSSSSFSIRGDVSYNNLYIVVTDSRGKKGTYTLSLNKISYSPPKISKIEAYRVTSTSDTTKDEVGGLACLVNVSLTNATSSVNGVTNSTVCKIKIGNNAEVTKTQSVAALNADSSTTYTVTITDTAGTKIVQTGTINSINYLMHFRKKVQSIGIGCVAPPTKNQLDIAWNISIKNSYPKISLCARGSEKATVFIEANGEGRLGFYSYSSNQENLSTRYYTGFRLPLPEESFSQEDTSNTNFKGKMYKILTSKDVISPIEGGTGCTTLESTRKAMGLGDGINLGPLGVTYGGTGANNGPDALQNLGIIYQSTKPAENTSINGKIWLKPITT